MTIYAATHSLHHIPPSRSLMLDFGDRTGPFTIAYYSLPLNSEMYNFLTIPGVKLV